MHSDFAEEEEVEDNEVPEVGVNEQNVGNGTDFAEEDEEVEDELSEVVVNEQNEGNRFKVKEGKGEEQKEVKMVWKKDRGFSITSKNSKLTKEYMKLELSGVEIAVGQRYETRGALEIRLKILCFVNKFDFKVDKSTSNLYIVKCWVGGCKWRIRASSVGKSPSLYIRKYNREHTCSVTERSARARQTTPDILAVLYKDFIGGVGPGVLPYHVLDALKLRYGIMVDYWKARRTLQAARELLRGIGVCTYHLVQRFRGSESFGLVKKAASAYRLVDFNVLYQQIHALNPELHSYLEGADVRQWTRVHFPGDRYNFTTSNIAESINKVLKPVRNYPIVQLLDSIRLMLTR